MAGFLWAAPRAPDGTKDPRAACLACLRILFLGGTCFASNYNTGYEVVFPKLSGDRHRLLLTGRTTSAQFSGLVKHIPGTANTIILLNAHKVLDSELAKAKGWQKNFEKASEAGLTRLPADTQQYVLASQTDFHLMRPVWELGMLKTSQPHSMVDVAEKRKGTEDKIADQEVVLLPSGTYIVQFDHRTFGSLMPASRQAIARWIRSSQTGAEHLSEYIREAIGYSEQVGTEIIMAIDLADVIDPEVVHERLNEYNSVSQQSIDVKNVAQAVMSIRGVTLGITLG